MVDQRTKETLIKKHPTRLFSRWGVALEAWPLAQSNPSSCCLASLNADTGTALSDATLASFHCSATSRYLAQMEMSFAVSAHAGLKNVAIRRMDFNLHVSIGYCVAGGVQHDASQGASAMSGCSLRI